MSFCVLMVFDSYNIEYLSRVPEINATLKNFVFTLVKEEVRDRFIGKEAYKILKIRQQLKQEVNDGLKGDRVRMECIKASILAKHISEIFESYRQ